MIEADTHRGRGRGPARFKKFETARVMRAALDAGLVVERVEVDPHSGSISVIAAQPGAAPAAPLSDDGAKP